jgi:polar amino acid transport system substrate-binding protein
VSRRREVTLAVWSVTSVLAVLSWATPVDVPSVPAGAVAHELRLAGRPEAPRVADPHCNRRASLRPPVSMPAPGAMPAGSAMARIAQRGVLIAGVDQNTFLFGYRDPLTGTLDGFETEIVRAIAKAMLGDENRIEFRQVNIADRLRLVESGEVDLVVNALTITCERRERVEFSGVYYEAGQRLLVAQGSPVTSLAGLAGKRVCAARGSTSLQRILTDPAKPIRSVCRTRSTVWSRCSSVRWTRSPPTTPCSPAWPRRTRAP